MTPKAIEMRASTLSLIALSLLCGCTARAPAPGNARFVALSLRYPTGADMLSLRDHERLVARVRALGDRLLRVVVVAWPDQHAPFHRKLAPTRERLAAERAEHVALVLEHETPVRNVVELNAAINGSRIALALQTPPTAFAKRAAPAPLTDHELAYARVHGGSSSVVIFLETK